LARRQLRGRMMIYKNAFHESNEKQPFHTVRTFQISIRKKRKQEAKLMPLTYKWMPVHFNCLVHALIRTVAGINNLFWAAKVSSLLTKYGNEIPMLKEHWITRWNNNFKHSVLEQWCLKRQYLMQTQKKKCL